MASALVVAQPPAQEVPQPGKPSVKFQRPAAAARVETKVMFVAPLAPAPRPTQILLGTLSTFGYRLVKPIPVRLDTQDGTVVASWHDVDEFGTGASMCSACEDLGRTLAELYKSLKADQEKLGPDLARIWQVLQEYVVEAR